MARESEQSGRERETEVVGILSRKSLLPAETRDRGGVGQGREGFRKGGLGVPCEQTEGGREAHGVTWEQRVRSVAAAEGAEDRTKDESTNSHEPSMPRKGIQMLRGPET